MPQLIDRNGLCIDTWFHYTSLTEADVATPDIPANVAVLLPLADFLNNYDHWKTRASSIGVRLAPADDPAQLVKHFQSIRLIAIEFPVYTDGRGYSQAALLRDYYNWSGELRAVGDVLRDQIFIMARSGFNSFALRDDQNLDSALSAFKDFSQHYQRAAADPKTAQYGGASP